MGNKKQGKKQSLQSLLHSQQNRLDKKRQAAQAALVAERKATTPSQAKSSKNKRKERALPQRITIPFLPTDRILLVGEGNFSFARALACYPPSDLEHLPPKNITATSYDSEDECLAKYSDAQSILDELRAKGVELLFSVDATKLEKCTVLKGRKWNRIVWNFPHAGKGITDQDRNILSNQLLLLGFLRSASSFLCSGSAPQVNQKRKHKKSDDDEDSDDNDDAMAHHALSDIDEALSGPSNIRGTILITLRNVAPYTQWDLPRLAKSPPPPRTVGVPPNPGYVLLRSFLFHRDAWNGYEHRMTKGERAHGQGKTGQGGEDRMWEFYLKDENV